MQLIKTYLVELKERAHGLYYYDMIASNSDSISIIIVKQTRIDTSTGNILPLSAIDNMLIPNYPVL